MYVKTAFLNGKLKKSVFMEIPERLEYSEEMWETEVCKLKRALYGLKVSPRRYWAIQRMQE